MQTSFLGDFRTALRFLTVFPLPGGTDPVTSNLARATVFFPLVGFLIGAVSLGLYLLARPFLPPDAADLILLLAPVALTGGLHLDGFADFCDGFFAGGNKAEILRIMKDPHIGVWGAVGLTMLLIAKWEFLHHLPAKAGFFLFAMIVSRWVQAAMAFCLPYAGAPGGLAERVAGKMTVGQWAGATFFLLPAFLLIPMKGWLVFPALAAFLICLGLFFQRRLGGITGDLLGAASELTELFVLVFAVLVLKG